MKRNDRLLIAFAGLCALQLCAPISMIAKREATLRTGTVVKVRTAPVDPYDAFRGRYVALRLETGTAGHPGGGLELVRGQRVYVPFVADDDGFSTFGTVTTERPEDGPYVRTRVNWWNIHKNEVHVDLPFNRYYMNEDDAPEAERAYNRHSRREERDAYVTLRVRRGNVVLEELYVADKPILDFLKQQADSSGS